MSTINFDRESASQQIETFFHNSVGDLDAPVLIVRQNCVTVGPYKVVTESDVYRVQRSGNTVAEFSRRSWAVAFALRKHNGDRKIADYLCSAESRYRKIVEDRYVYRKHLGRAQRRNDQNKVILFEARLSRVESELDALIADIEPILKNSHR